MPTDKPRYTIIVDEELLKEIDDFRFENRYPSRSAATLELIRLGIAKLKEEAAEHAKQKKLSSNYTETAEEILPTVEEAEREYIKKISCSARKKILSATNTTKDDAIKKICD